MKLLVDKHNIELIKEEDVNENEVNVSKCFFEFSSEYNEYPELIKKAIFILKDKAYEMLISNDQCDYPPEILLKEDYVTVGVYAYEIDEDKIVKRFSPTPVNFEVKKGSYRNSSENSKPITPSEMEQYQQALQNALNMLLKSGKSIPQGGNKGQVLVKATDEDFDLEWADGGAGSNGRAATIKVGQVITGEPGSDVKITNSGDEHDAIFDFSIPRGNDGEQGQQGIPGEPGKAGKDGITPSIQIGNTITTDSDSNAQVTQRGTSENPIFDFSIPRGKDGNPGEPGQDGNDGEDGATFIPNIDGDGTLSWSNNKNLPNPESKNVKGPPGENGKDYIITEQDYQSIAEKTKKMIPSAENQDIDAKENKDKPITPYYLDYAIKVGMTTNNNALSDEEKKSVQEWIGIASLIGDIETILDNINGEVI